LKGVKNGARVLEGPVPDRKIFGKVGGKGAGHTAWGLRRFRHASFSAMFPFGKISLRDPDMPVAVKLTGWSPFIPNDEDNSSLPVAALDRDSDNMVRPSPDGV